jgi:hypothetical protein
LAACGQPTPSEETSRTSSALYGAANWGVTGPTQQQGLTSHETSSTSVAACDLSHGCPGPRQWVTVFNNNQNCYPTVTASPCGGWAYSNDINGSSWTAQVQSTGLDFAPNPGNCSDGNAFAGWGGDPSIAPVTDPTINNGGTRLLYTNLGNSTVNPYTDVIVAISTNGGHGWGNTNFVTTPGVSSGGGASGGFMGGNGYQDDQPAIASNSLSPYGSWVSWTYYDIPHYTSQGYINSVRYDLSLTYSTGYLHPVQVPPAPVSSGVFPFEQAAVSVTSMQTCSPGLHEIVFVAFDTSPVGLAGVSRCGGNRDNHTSPVSWWLNMYDATVGQWLFPNAPLPLGTDAQFPDCVGNLSAGAGGQIGYPGTNSQKPALAVAPGGPDFWIANVQSSLSLPGYTHSEGTRVAIHHRRLSCINGQMAVSNLGDNSAPDTCYGLTGWGPCTGDAGSGGQNGPDGGYVVNDEWEPGLGFLWNYNTQPATPELFATWYDTRLDPANDLVGVWGAWTTCTTPSCNPFNNVFYVSHNISPTYVSWDFTEGLQWDYNVPGVDPNTYSFLAVWGGDARNGQNADGGRADGIWSSRVQ